MFLDSLAFYISQLKMQAFFSFSPMLRLHSFWCSKYRKRSRNTKFWILLRPGSHSNGYFRKLAILSEFSATFTIPQLTCKFCYILIIFALREDLICHFSITYCLRYQGDRVLFRLFCIIYQSVMLMHILNEIATLWLINMQYMQPTVLCCLVTSFSLAGSFLHTMEWSPSSV